MTKMMGSLLLCLGCATTNPYQYEEAVSCPARMTEEEHSSGVVRCRALCSSYGRDLDSYGADCKCFCAPAGGGGGQRGATKAPWSASL